MLLLSHREVQAAERTLNDKRASLRAQLDADPRTPACVQTREELHVEILNTRCDVVLWTQRLAQLQDLHVNLKPVYEYEQAGRFNPKTFPLEASASLYSSVGRDSHSRARGRLSSEASVGSRLSEASQSFPHREGGSRSPSPQRSQLTTAGTDMGAGAVDVGIAYSAPVSANTSAAGHISASGGACAAEERPGGSLALSVHINHDEPPQHQSPAASVHSQFSSHHSPVPHTKLVPMMVKPAELEELIERDPSLGVALAPLRGKEAQLLVTLPDEHKKKQPVATASVSSKNRAVQRQQMVERDQNMIAWITLKVRMLFQACARAGCSSYRSRLSLTTCISNLGVPVADSCCI
jgi:hypothetical protein